VLPVYSFEIGARSRGRSPPPDDGPVGGAPVPRVVYWIGLSSLLADISAESVSSVLPVFLFSVLQLSALQVGFLDGLYQGGAALVRVLAALVADRRLANRAIATAGYALSVLSRLGLLLSGSLGLLAAVVSLCIDRFGKGIRTAPRDSLIAGHTPRNQIGASFGVHRSMDAVGAFLGPLIGAAILWLLPFRFDWLFAVSFAFGLAGLIVFRLTVTEPRPDTIADNAVPAARPGVLRMLWANASFKRLTLLAVVLSIFTVSDGLVYLWIQRDAGIDERYVPLMFAATALAFIATARPIGRLADRIRSGPASLFLVGYAVLAFIYLWLAFGALSSWLTIPVILVLLGVHYAATDGVLAAAAVHSLDPRARTTGLAVLTTAIGLTRIGSSSLFGWVWEYGGSQLAMKIFSFGALGCCLLALIVLRAISKGGATPGAG
jgi:MFS family permease